MKYHLMLAWFLALMTAGISCSDRNIHKGLTGDVNGFSFNLLPNKLDKNGYVFAVDKKSKQHLPITFVNVPVISDDAFLANKTETVKSKIGMLVNVLSAEKDSVHVNMDMDFNKEISAQLKFKDAVLDRTPLLDAGNAIEASSKDISKRLTMIDLSNYTFYIILESIKAKNLEYTFDKSTLQLINANVAIQKLIKANPHLSISHTNGYDLSFKSDGYVNVLYKVLPLSIITTKGDKKIVIKEDAGQYIQAISL